MRKILILIFLVLTMTSSVSALEYTAPQAPESVEDLMPVETESFADGLWKIVKNAISKLRPDLKDGATICLSVIAVSMLVSILRQMPGNSSVILEITGALAISVLLVSSTGAMIKLGTDTVTELSEYGKLLLPVMSGAMAASGATASSAALYAGTAVFDTLLSSLIAKLLVPMVYAFLILSVAAAATGESMVEKLRDLMKWLMSWSLKTILYIFTGYIGITGVVSGSTDAAALKATKLTISGMVPLVGGILSEASEAVIVGAGVVKSAAGVYGLLAISAIWISPFLKLGIQYLLLKLTAAVCEVFECKLITDLIGSFSTAMGFLLPFACQHCLLYEGSWVMGDAGSYLLQVTTAGILSGIIKHLFGSKGMIGSAVKLLTGIFMTLIVTAPLLNIRIDSLFDGFDDIQADGIYAATQGENNAKEAMAEIITRQTQAYILDKAESLGAELTVTLYLTDDLPPVPCRAQISGKVSPYAKRILSEYMETELGISMEAQTWTG